MKKKWIFIAIFVVAVMILYASAVESTFAADNLATYGTIELMNTTKVTPFDRVQWLSYDPDDINYARWSMMCSDLQPGKSCRTDLLPGNYIVRTEIEGRTGQVFTDVKVTAGQVTRLYSNLVWYYQAIRVFNNSNEDIEHLYAQEGNWVSEAVSLKEEMFRGTRKLSSIGPGEWGEITVNRLVPTHHILIRGERNEEWFYNVPANGVIFWYGTGGDVYYHALYLSFINGPAAVFANLNSGEFVELQLQPLSDGATWAYLPNEYHRNWNIAILDTYCGGSSYGSAYCSVSWDTVMKQPFVIDACNYDYPCNGAPGLPFPYDAFPIP